MSPHLWEAGCQTDSSPGCAVVLCYSMEPFLLDQRELGTGVSESATPALIQEWQREDVVICQFFWNWFVLVLFSCVPVKLSFSLSLCLE